MQRLIGALREEESAVILSRVCVCVCERAEGSSDCKTGQKFAITEPSPPREPGSARVLHQGIRMFLFTSCSVGPCAWFPVIRRDRRNQRLNDLLMLPSQLSAPAITTPFALRLRVRVRDAVCKHTHT